MEIRSFLALQDSTEKFWGDVYTELAVRWGYQIRWYSAARHANRLEHPYCLLIQP